MALNFGHQSVLLCPYRPYICEIFEPCLIQGLQPSSGAKEKWVFDLANGWITEELKHGTLESLKTPYETSQAFLLVNAQQLYFKDQYRAGANGTLTSIAIRQFARNNKTSFLTDDH